MSRITTIFISLLVVFLLGFFYAWPQYHRVIGLTADLQERKIELELKKDYFTSVEKAAQELEQYKEEVVKIDSAIPTKSSLPSLFNFVGTTASQNGLILAKIGKFSVSPSREREGIKDIFLEVTLAGSYSSFKNFLAALEKTSRIIKAENIIFKAPKPEEDSFSFDLKLKAYSY